MTRWRWPVLALVVIGLVASLPPWGWAVFDGKVTPVVIGQPFTNTVVSFDLFATTPAPTTALDPNRPTAQSDMVSLGGTFANIIERLFPSTPLEPAQAVAVTDPSVLVLTDPPSVGYLQQFYTVVSSTPGLTVPGGLMTSGQSTVPTVTAQPVVTGPTQIVQWDPVTDGLGTGMAVVRPDGGFTIPGNFTGMPGNSLVGNLGDPTTYAADTTTNAGIFEAGGCVPCEQTQLLTETGQPVVIEQTQFNVVQPLAVGTFQTGTRPPASVQSHWAFGKLGLPVIKPGDRLVPVTVAVVDSGLDFGHPLVRRDQVWRNPRPGVDRGYPGDVIGWNFVAGTNNPRDDYGHGTFIAGQIIAVNPVARIMALKVTDRLGRTDTKRTTEAILYAVRHGARVINLSLGGKGLSKANAWAIDHARERGVVVVVAAGNEGVDTAGYGPAGIPGALAVGATDQNDKKPPFGNWGQQVALAAPGVDVVSLHARRTDFVLIATMGKGYKPGENILGPSGLLYKATGTSFAAPFVSGAAALLLSRDPNLTGRQVERMLVESADDVETPGWDQFTGAGRLNVARALQADPNYALTVKVASVQPAREGGQVVIRVSGTVTGSRLDGYEIQLGQGDSPAAWKTVGGQKGKEIEAGTLADIPVKEITARGRWLVRVVARDDAGKTKEGRGGLNVQ